jgi:hypothetical protein
MVVRPIVLGSGKKLSGCLKVNQLDEI